MWFIGILTFILISFIIFIVVLIRIEPKSNTKLNSNLNHIKLKISKNQHLFTSQEISDIKKVLEDIFKTW